MELGINQLGKFVLVDLEKKGKQIKDSLEKVHLYFILFIFFFSISQKFEKIINKINITGFYFTTSFEYASKYAKFSKKADGKIFVIGVTIVGNSYPAIEPPQFTLADGVNPLLFSEKTQRSTLYGLQCKRGYQSHFALGNFFSFLFFSFLFFFFSFDPLNQNKMNK